MGIIAKTIKYLLILVLTLYMTICCSSQSKKAKFNFDCQIYYQFSQVSDLNTFSVENMDFKSINTKLFKPVKEYNLIKNSDPSEEYFFYSHIKEYCTLILLSKSEFNSKSIKLHLVTLSDDGNVNNKLIIADKTSYPGSFSETKSKLKGDELTLIRIERYVGDYIEDEDRYTSIEDSITIKYKLLEGFCKQVYMDSTRFNK